MDRNSKIVIVAILASAIASCSSEGEQSTHPTPSPTNIPTANLPFNNPVVSVNKKVTNQSFSNPVVSTKATPAVVPITTANLIQPTDSTKRLGIVSKGRNDPFAKIVIPYSIRVTNPPARAKPVPKLPPLPVARSKWHSVIVATSKNLLNQQKLNQQKHRINKKAIAQGAVAFAKRLRQEKPIARSTAPQMTHASTEVKPNRTFTHILPKVLPQAIPNPALASVTPSQPELAKAVFVSGVILVGKEPQAIIKVPNEPTSQYVRVGQQLANGVLIKRIEMNEGSEPVIILEQYGIEVARMVGQGLTTQTPPTAASEGNPVSLTRSPQHLVPGGAI
ncbi:MAG: hypothetical protein KME30_20870 [Iphinoe sp. HA4291-MV1]|jgi:hypothetical protein|nr:hypothetical protein [Iphinoe sp. HA4291-MV1]